MAAKRKPSILATAILGHVRVWTRLLVAVIAIGAIPAVVHASTLATLFVAENSPLGLARNLAPARALADRLQAPESPLESGFGYAQIVVDNAYATRGGLDALSKAAGAADRGGLTAAGRALAKHGGRPGSAFPTPKGNPAQINRAGQDIVDDILTSPGSTTVTRHHARYGNVTEVRAPDGRGVRYDSGGNFMGFLEP
jgi:stage V sporulation protein SpoVS